MNEKKQTRWNYGLGHASEDSQTLVIQCNLIKGKALQYSKCNKVKNVIL